MNKQEILDSLEAARQIISFNHPFEYKAPYGQWRNPRLGVDALRYVANGFDVRMKQLSDKWADLKKAHENGKVIQWKLPGEDNHLWRDTMMPIWKEGTDYRIKPETIRIPLDPEDVPDGSAIRLKSDRSYIRQTIIALSDRHVVTHSGKTLFETLEEYYEINRSLSNGKWDPAAWEPCYKEVTKE